MEPSSPSTDLLALRILPTAIRCREIGGGLVTYRRKLPLIVPGQRLTISLEKRWEWRRTQMVGGPLLFVDFSLRAIHVAGFGRTEHRGGALVSPADDDSRLREALLSLEDDWVIARALLLDVLEDAPGNLLAQATLGDIHARVEHLESASAHYTAAIRLGLGALVHEGSLPLDPRRETERALLRSLVGRARILLQGGREDAAAADLARALAWDPTDVAGAGPELQRLLAGSELAPAPQGAGA